MYEFSAEALPAIHSVKPKESFNAVTVPEAVAALRTYSEAKPYDSTIRPVLDLGAALSKTRDYGFLTLLLQDCAEWLTFFHHSVLYRSVLYANEVVTGMNDRAFARVPVATRSLLELFLYTYTTYRYIYQTHEQTKRLSPAQARRAIEIQINVRDYLLKQSAAARINWDDPFGPKWKEVRQHLYQTNVLSLFPKLPNDQRDTVERWYALLSDACHPNFGSTLFVLDHDEIKDNPPNFRFTRSSTGPMHFQLAVDLISAPLGFSCTQLVNFLTLLEQVLLHYRDGVNRFDPKTNRGKGS